MKLVAKYKTLLKALSLAIIVCTPLTSAGADLLFNGSRVISIKAESSSGLDKIYVVENLTGVTVSYSSNNAKWSKWGNMGAAYGEMITTGVSGNLSTYIFADGNDCGITIEDGGRMYHFWIVNYAKHQIEFTNLSIKDGDDDCQSMYLNIEPLKDGNDYSIDYFTINGAPRELDRGYRLTYNTLEYSTNSMGYNQIAKEETIATLKSSIRVSKPLCDTQFILSGDRFAREWGKENVAESPIYTTDAVEATTYAEQEERDNDNEQNDQTTGLGGSAPVNIRFVAAITDAAQFTEWQLSASSEFETYELRFNQTEVDYTFTEYGTWYMRFQASNAAGTCDYFSETYEIHIGESRLVCPNAFSPNASEGVNDEWKVSYKSIVEFECHIFNRWGTKIISLTDPSQGWDGKYNGKYVPAGVYYYVIKARGSDGHKYDLSGDINILKYKEPSGQTTVIE